MVTAPAKLLRGRDPEKTDDQIEGPGRILGEDQFGELHSRNGAEINGVQGQLEKMGLRRLLPREPGSVGGDQRLLGPERKLFPPPRGHLQNLIPITGARQGCQPPGGPAVRGRNPTQKQENR